MKFFKYLFVISFSLFFLVLGVSAASNPYGKYQTLYGVKTIRCTWYAWQQAYDNGGVTLPGWGNAQTWYNSAIKAGYSVGKVAKPNSIVVFSSLDGYGHVAYVVSVNEDTIIVNEAGIPQEANEGVINGSIYSVDSNNLIGFIYLDEAPKTSSSSNNKEDSKNVSSKNQSSNNNLLNLEIDIPNFTFDSKTTEYDLSVPFETKIISITTTAEDEKAIVTGGGDKALKVGENTYNILVTAENGDTKEYKITITRNAKINEEKKATTTVESNKKHNTKVILIVICSVVILITILVFSLIKINQKKNK